MKGASCSKVRLAQAALDYLLSSVDISAKPFLSICSRQQHIAKCMQTYRSVISPSETGYKRVCGCAVASLTSVSPCCGPQTRRLGFLPRVIPYVPERAQLRQNSCCGEILWEAENGEKDTSAVEMWGTTVWGRKHWTISMSKEKWEKFCNPLAIISTIYSIQTAPLSRLCKLLNGVTQSLRNPSQAEANTDYYLSSRETNETSLKVKE